MSVSAAEQLALVMEHVRHGIVIYDRDERILLINQYVSRIFGLSDSAVTAGSSLADYLHHVGNAVGWSDVRKATILDNHRQWAREGCGASSIIISMTVMCWKLLITRNPILGRC
ncbi:hypothetical protein GCM10020258_43550 [Sphingomonas yabuuchiae]